MKRAQRLRSMVAATLSALQIFATLAAGEMATSLPARAAYTCYAGNDGAGGSLAGAANSYYQPPVGTLSAGATSVPLGTMDTSNGGAATAVAAKDLLLIIQMQDGSLSGVNSASYGMTSVGNAGLYEYVQVSSVTGGTATIVGGGSGGGLINSYTESAAVPGASGQKTYQIIRVPQFTTATLTNTFQAAYWDGKTGGVAALDIASTLNLGGASVYATGDGFRGGGVSVSATSPSSILNSDWAASATMNGTPTSNAPAHGFKGEGILGTPAFAFGYTNFTTPSTPGSPGIVKTATDGYPGGDMARGAPGNAGGGGTDDDPAANDQNTGGGGGSNGGAGGNGGWPWSPNEPQYSTNSPGQHTASSYAAPDATHNPDIGGRGAAAMTLSSTRAFMGGGGGAGSNNNGTNNNAVNNYGSSGGTGGGIIMMRIADTSGSPATIYADGTTGLAPDNDGGGGGGAGGTVIITSPNTFTGITVYARGAAGTSAYYKAGDTSSTTQHGPGGGGGGGAIYSSSPVTATVSGGANGVTLYGVGNAYGATSGSAGTTATVSASSIPGVPSGADCYSTSGTTLFAGPVASPDPYGGAAYTGSYDGVAPVTNNNDFTARSFVPIGATMTNTGTTPGSPIGNTLSGTATVNVPNEIYYANTAGNKAKTPTISVTAPSTPSGWTVRLCPDNGGAPDCTGTTVAPFAPSAAGTTTSATVTIPKGQTLLWPIWAVYAVPSGTRAFSRYDAVLSFSDGTNTNLTHNELYAGFIPITKQTTVVSNGCPANVTPPASGICPGGVLTYTLDYRDVMAGGGQGTEGQLLSAFLATAPGQLTITDNGAATGNNWATNTNGLKEALLAALGSGNSSCGATANKCGDSTAGTTFTGGTAGSTSFTATIGGASFQLVPAGITSGTSQGTITFSVVIK